MTSRREDETEGLEVANQLLGDIYIGRLKVSISPLLQTPIATRRDISQYFWRVVTLPCPTICKTKKRAISYIKRCISKLYSAPVKEYGRKCGEEIRREAGTTEGKKWENALAIFADTASSQHLNLS